MGGAQLGQDRPDLGAVTVGNGVVGQDPLDGDAMAGEEGAGSAQEPRAGRGALIAQHLGIRQPGVVVDSGVHIVVADPVATVAILVAGPVLTRVAAMHPVATAVAEPGQLLDIDMDQLPRPLAFGAADRAAGGPVHPGQPVEPVADRTRWTVEAGRLTRAAMRAGPNL